MGGVFDGVWHFGRRFSICCSEEDGQEKTFRGFIEPLELFQERTKSYEKPGMLSRDKYRLLAEPTAELVGDMGLCVSCDGWEYEVLSVKDICLKENITHRECAVIRIRKVTENA